MNTNYINFPAWLENNYLFRKLFLFRKIYLTKSKFHHHSQFAEDISIVRCFPKTHKGFFVDVGCFHPIKYNNTWKLYKKGWRGINIDIDSIKIEGFNLIRSKDTNVCRAVGNQEGEVHYWKNGFYSLTASLDDDFVQNKMGYIKKSTQCSRLTSILDDSKYKGQRIDLLSVDAEGHDLEVLRSLDFERYAPLLVAAEAHHALFTEVSKSELYKFLVEKGYCLVGWSGLTLLMASEELQQTLANQRY